MPLELSQWQVAMQKRKQIHDQLNRDFLKLVRANKRAFDITSIQKKRGRWLHRHKDAFAWSNYLSVNTECVYGKWHSCYDGDGPAWIRITSPDVRSGQLSSQSGLALAWKDREMLFPLLRRLTWTRRAEAYRETPYFPPLMWCRFDAGVLLLKDVVQ
jgi:hypothetical protein